jgi:hypothetical protein
MKSEIWNQLSRRSFLHGVGGAALALPWLESLAMGAKEIKPAQRIAFYYVPIGVIRRGFFPGEHNEEVRKFVGTKTKLYEGAKLKIGVHDLLLTPTMQPLKKVKSKITLVTGMDRVFQNGTDVHAQCASCFLSSAAPYTVKSSAWPLDRTLDQVIADHVGRETPFRSLELSCNSHKDNRESIHFDNISWYGTGHVAPSIRDPRKAYRRLFGTKEIQNIRDITDLVLEDARTLKGGLGSSDQRKFDEYFESVRTIEKQIDKLEKMKGELDKVSIEEPSAAYLPRGEYMRLMGDLMVTALQTGLTNVASMMVGPERWDTPYKFEGLFDKPRSHHGMSHNPQKHVQDLLKVDKFHVAQFAYIAEKMDSIKEANGTTLLDNTMFTFGSGLGDGSTHQYNDLPIIVAGAGGGKIKTGRHINCANGTPLSNLWLTQAQVMGVKRERFADSTGLFAPLLA